MRAKVFWLLMLTVSRITRLRSVKWLPSLRAKEQKISISLTAYSLALRSVNVTRALDPSPPLRQDCDDILSPSTGEVSTGAIASSGVTCGVKEDSSCTASVAGDCTGSLADAVAKGTGSGCTVAVVLLADPDSTNHAPDATITTAESQMSFDGRYFAAVFAGAAEQLPMIPANPESPVLSTRYSPVSIA